LCAEKTKLTKKEPAEIELAVGSTLTLSALAVSDRTTPVKYEWTRNGKLLFDGSSNVHIIIGDDNVANLTIFDIQPDEFGVYKCRATNGISYDEFETEVKSPPAGRPIS